MRDALRTALVLEGTVPRTFGRIGGVALFRTGVEKVTSVAFKVTRPLVKLAFSLSERKLLLLEFQFGEFFDALFAPSYLVLVDR